MLGAEGHIFHLSVSLLKKMQQAMNSADSGTGNSFSLSHSVQLRYLQQPVAVTFSLFFN